MTTRRSGVTRSAKLTTSLHYSSLAKFREANDGTPHLDGQSIHGLDNGYGLQGNPTSHELQEAISKLEHGKYTLLYSSGLTALTALGGLLQSGDHWLIPGAVYAPVLRYANYLKERYGIQFDTYASGSVAELETLITPQTKLIHIETPASVTFETTGLHDIAVFARKHNILTSADNTWASGLLCSPLTHGIDISILSLTKYAAGYSDVFMGSITTSHEQIFTNLAYHHRVYGYTVSPISTMLVQRGLESLPARLAAHEKNALHLVEEISTYPHVAKLYTADIQGTAEIHGINGLFSVELTRRFSDAELEKPLSSLKTFTIGESWGGTKSLILPFHPEELPGRRRTVQGTVLRFHSGLEDIELQLKDIRRLFTALRKAS